MQAMEDVVLAVLQGLGQQRLQQLRTLDSLWRHREPQRQNLASLDAPGLRSFARR
jgi:hypothetical protein